MCLLNSKVATREEEYIIVVFYNYDIVRDTEISPFTISNMGFLRLVTFGVL